MIRWGRRTLEVAPRSSTAGKRSLTELRGILRDMGRIEQVLRDQFNEREAQRGQTLRESR